ncbi:unnamed protein product [Vicia faba]|uniref:Uncharacterized protein n=1 Tax=Vicia faba TaxID=3906 RepID=A0AAV1A4Q9_VICFA|nr:unnamed protein product [Vicia faba]
MEHESRRKRSKLCFGKGNDSSSLSSFTVSISICKALYTASTPAHVLSVNQARLLFSSVAVARILLNAIAMVDFDQENSEITFGLLDSSFMIPFTSSLSSKDFSTERLQM